jgi:NAD(P)-dependent dehydrogenase (short-subunit alcohol dehydrogenase family)
LTEGFLRQGARVAFVQRSDGTAFCDQMEAETGQRPMFIKCDITDIPALKAAMAQSAEAHGPISCLVNNAANDDRHDTLAVDEEYYDWMMNINFKSYFFACQAAVPGMQAAGGGSIINVSSVSFMMGNGGYPLYTGANAAIMGMTRSFARDFGKDGIRANAIMPGWVLTEKQMRLWANPEALAVHLERQCIPEHLKPEDIVGMTLFLASDSSRMVTSQAMVVDGGVVMTG